MVKRLTGGDWGTNKGENVGKCRVILVESLAAADDSRGTVTVDKSDEVARLQSAERVECWTQTLGSSCLFRSELRSGRENPKKCINFTGADLEIFQEVDDCKVKVKG